MGLAIFIAIHPDITAPLTVISSGPMRYGHCYFYGPIHYGGGVEYILVAAQNPEDASTWKAEITAKGDDHAGALRLALQQTSSGHPAHKAISEELDRQPESR